MLATAYLMNPVDVSNEGVCAVGKYPVIIDAETVSSMNIFSKGTKKEKTFLDKCMFKDIERIDVEIVDEFTSKAKQRRIKKKCEDNNTHLLKLGKRSIPTWDYMEDVLSGFDEGYDNISNNDFQINNLLRNYENTKIRIALRDTEDFSKIF